MYPRPQNDHFRHQSNLSPTLVPYCLVWSSLVPYQSAEPEEGKPGITAPDSSFVFYLRDRDAQVPTFAPIAPIYALEILERASDKAVWEDTARRYWHEQDNPGRAYWGGDPLLTVKWYRGAILQELTRELGFEKARSEVDRIVAEVAAELKEEDINERKNLRVLVDHSRKYSEPSPEEGAADIVSGFAQKLKQYFEGGPLASSVLVSNFKASNVERVSEDGEPDQFKVTIEAQAQELKAEADVIGKVLAEVDSLFSWVESIKAEAEERSEKWDGTETTFGDTHFLADAAEYGRADAADQILGANTRRKISDKLVGVKELLVEPTILLTIGTVALVKRILAEVVLDERGQSLAELATRKLEELLDRVDQLRRAFNVDLEKPQ